MKPSILLMLALHLMGVLSTATPPLKRESEKVIYLSEKTSHTIRLKSVRSLMPAAASPHTTTQKIFWSFKRIYFTPAFINELQPLTNRSHLITKSKSELSQVEQMISLDAEVQDTLSDKYWIDEAAALKYDLVIKNLTFADAGLYKCNLWNQKTVYYYLFVTSAVATPEIEYDSRMVVANEANDVSVTCRSKHSYPYPNFKWFRNEASEEIKSGENKISINYTLVDKETNTIESVLTISNVTSQFHMNNFTCKLVQIQDQIDDKSLSSSGADAANSYMEVCES